MKSLIELYGVLSTEIESRCCASVHSHATSGLGLETQRDLRYVRDRIDCEGLSFLTISLPSYGKDFERSLDLGRVTDDSFRSFRKAAGLPKYLGWALRRVFDPASRALLQEPDLEAIAGIRQLTLMFSKMEIDCSTERVDRAFQRYLEVEDHVKEFSESRFSDCLAGELSCASRVLFGTVLGRVEETLNGFELVPAHGPGSTADRRTGNQKFVFRQWHERLNDFFPPEDFILPSHRFYTNLQDIDMVEPRNEPPVRVVDVPKTLKTPRIIAMEPTCMMYVQKAIAGALYDRLEGDPFLAGMIGFTDQEPNRFLAREGSRRGHLASLDLSDASDRVSIRHVQALLRDVPDLSGAIFAARSTHAEVPHKGSTVKVELRKFASMGSALTFPLEAMVFLAVIFIGIARAQGVRVTPGLVKRFRGMVRVYGDDLIVPVDHAQSVVDTLEAFGFKVNTDKSFWTGRFRESCGGDFYNGSDVSYVKVRHMISFQPMDVTEFVSTVDLRNRFYWHGYWSTAKWMDERYRSRGVLFPTIHANSEAIGRHTLLDYEVHRVCSQLHRPLVKAFVSESRLEVNPLDGHPALLKFFIKQGDDPLPDDHLLHSGRAVSVRIKARMAQPF